MKVNSNSKISYHKETVTWQEMFVFKIHTLLLRIHKDLTANFLFFPFFGFLSSCISDHNWRKACVFWFCCLFWPSERLFVFQVFDYDWGLQDDFMGSAFLDLTKFELGKWVQFENFVILLQLLCLLGLQECTVFFYKTGKLKCLDTHKIILESSMDGFLAYLQQLYDS